MWYNRDSRAEELEAKEIDRSKIMIKLVTEEKPKGIWVGHMNDGDVAVIVGCFITGYLGRIVQRYENNLITIGKSEEHWEPISRLPDNFCVRLLEKGETLIVA